jgi:glutamate/tyrosine decarboxylase-like PLP-dependent enzyme
MTTTDRAPALDDTSTRTLLYRAADHAADFLDGLDERPVQPGGTHATLYAALGGELPAEGEPAEQVIDELVAGTADGLLDSTGGAFFGWVIGGVLPAALAADWLTSAWDQNTASYAHAPAQTVVEQITGEWVIDLLGLPPHASFAAVTGSQMGHVTALAAARNGLLHRAGWDVSARGLFGAPTIQVVCSADRHASIDRALRLLGFGTGAIHAVATEASGRIDLGALEHALAATAGSPTILCLQAGDLHTGAFDPFEQAIDLARGRENVWVHIDGAFGLWAAASPRHRGLTAGMERADSWVTDAHKMLNTPYDCGFAIVADSAAHRSATAMQASYMPPAAGAARDPMDWTPEWSRRSRATPVYAALRSLGRDGVAALIDADCEHAAALVAGIHALDGAEAVAFPVFNQGLIRFHDPDGSDRVKSDHSGRGLVDRDPADSDLSNLADDAFTDRVVARIQRDGQAWFGSATWRGMHVMRVSVCDWRTTPAHVERAIEAVAAAIAAELALGNRTPQRWQPGHQ